MTKISYFIVDDSRKSLINNTKNVVLFPVILTCRAAALKVNRRANEHGQCIKIPGPRMRRGFLQGEKREKNWYLIPAVDTTLGGAKNKSPLSVLDKQPLEPLKRVPYMYR